jgi:hypothetical protein
MMPCAKVGVLHPFLAMRRPLPPIHGHFVAMRRPFV